MRDALRGELLQRLQVDYGLQAIKGTLYLRKGTCPACGKRELYCRSDAPWTVHCGRESKCGQQWHVKELYEDLFDDWSDRVPATDQQPNATARAYLEFARGFHLELIEGWFSQENFWSRELGEGSATVRFALEKGGYWERLIDRPHRFGKQKARFKPGASYKGVWWCPPCVDLFEVKELWIVEGIFDAIALLHHGIAAVAALSSNAFPEESLKALARNRGGKLPKLVWALDNEPGAHRYTKKWVRQARELGYACDAAQVPQPDSRKLDWNDLHQRWSFESDEEKRADLRHRALEEARHFGALLLAETASEKALLMYEWRERQEFHFGFGQRLYWFKLDLEKFNKAVQALESSDHHDDQLLNNRQMREKALRQSGCVTEIANCYPEALYFQRNEITDESWYYFRVDFPHDGPSVKNTFTGAQVAAASEFKKRLLSMAAGAVFTGSGQQLDKIMKDQLYGLKTVETIDYVGYSKEHGCYVFGDVAVRNGVVNQVNAEDFFEFGKLRLKSLQKSIVIRPERDSKRYDEEWLRLLWTCFGAQGLVGLTFFFTSLFAEQIRGRWQSFPFLEMTGEPGAGKSTLLMFLWKLLGRAGYEGFDPSKSSVAGRSRLMGQVAGMPVVLIEADRNEPDRLHLKSFDWDELKDFYGGGTLRTRGMKTAGNETYEPPFRGTIVISQNAPVSASEAILTRICKLHFVRPTATDESIAAADNLNALDGDQLSHFLLRAVKHEAQVLERFAECLQEHDARLRHMHTRCFACGQPFANADENAACSHCGNRLRGQIRIERIIKNHAQLLASLDCLRLVVKLSEHQVNQTRLCLAAMALERQSAVSADHPAVAEFWEVFEYLESLDDGPVVNHSKNPKLIAINLNEFVQRASEHRQQLADVGTLREVLRNSQSRKFLGASKAVDSAVRSHHALRNPMSARPGTVKCWTFSSL
ncbi:bifunctional DNA primase/helicase [Metapseudomonas lalkuanensis]|uniref:Bifunctional DNA primase/helicase n=1 Tax=Metapseudomonas lalkuanensis TaxID=2604832 RepID=A0A5J6QLS5_9GAMM|nr:toprim domain-containing protein [Pseudomonas lalkuanensis]QEY63393.1 bifunctional DNA primase/helicase [Pseudomonas lalkuanensis]